MPDSSTNPILLYDGVCGFCNGLIRFILKRDSGDRFRFASLQSKFAAQVLQRHGIKPQLLDTSYVVLEYQQPAERLAARSDAIVVVLRGLGGIWSSWAVLLRMLPLWFRDWGYNLIARHRYRLFGKYNSCPLPEERDRRKFLDL